MNTVNTKIFFIATLVGFVSTAQATTDPIEVRTADKTIVSVAPEEIKDAFQKLMRSQELDKDLNAIVNPDGSVTIKTPFVLQGGERIAIHGNREYGNERIENNRACRSFGFMEAINGETKHAADDSAMAQLTDTGTVSLVAYSYGKANRYNQVFSSLTCIGKFVYIK